MDSSTLRAKAEGIVANIEQVIFGKREEIELAVASLLCQGHLLIEDKPGTGKTVLAKAIAISIDAEFSRIQFTADLLPSDISGVSIYDQGQGEFRFMPGPIFAPVVLADEINRATPKAQASLLECMDEYHVTVDGITHELPQPFFVLGTENPIEYHGTYPLPEAQLDRFLLRLTLGYPDHDTEVDMLTAQRQRHPLDDLGPVVTPDEILEMQQVVRDVPVPDVVKDYIVRLTSATRDHRLAVLGVSPRGSLGLMRMAQAWSLLRGLPAPREDEVKAVAPAVMSHRLVLSPEARGQGLDGLGVVDQLLREVEVAIV